VTEHNTFRISAVSSPTSSSIAFSAIEDNSTSEELYNPTQLIQTFLLNDQKKQPAKTNNLWPIPQINNSPTPTN
jgi:hypothetical protein